MNITLLFPPKNDITQPHINLPSLTAYLKMKGIDNVEQRDIGVEAYDALVSGRRLRRSLETVTQRLREMNRAHELDYAAGGEYAALARAKATGPYVVEHIDWAKSVLRDPQAFFNHEKHFKALDLIKKANQLLSAEFYPTQLEEYSYSMKYSHHSSSEVLAAVRDEKTNMFLEYFKTHVIPGIKEGLVGISITYLYQVIPAFTLASLIKEKLGPKVHIVVGGPIFTRLVDNLRKSPRLFDLVDSFVIGEGELALLRLVETLEAKGDLADVPSLVYREKGKVIVNEYSFVNNVNQLPTPCFDGLPMDKYLTPYPVIYLQTARGCYWNNCTFCDIPYFQATYYRSRYRPRKAEQILEDIATLSKRHGTRYFSLWDEATSPKTLKQLSGLMLRENMDIQWYAQVRFEKAFTPELCDRMAKAGCRHVSFGFESGCPKILRLMKKGTDQETIETVLKAFYDAQIGTAVTWFIGFPGETLEDIKETVRFITTNRKYIDCADVPGRFVLFKYSEIEQNPAAYGIDKIIEGDYDIAVAYKYRPHQGVMGMYEVWNTQRQVIERMRELGYTEGRYGAYYLLFQSHYNQKYPPYCPPAVQKQAQGDSTAPLPAAHTGDIPYPSEAAVLESLTFDIKAIQQKILEKKYREQELILEQMLPREDAEKIVAEETPNFQPTGSFTLSCGKTGKSVYFNSQSDVIALFRACNGKDSADRIIHKLAETRKVPYNRQLEIRCLKVMDYLADNGFIGLKPMAG